MNGLARMLRGVVGRPPYFCVLMLVVCAFALPLRADTNNDQVILEIQYGKLLSQKILSRYPLYRNRDLTMYVNKVGKSVAMFAGRSELSYHFAVLDTDGINAFAAPGGYIYITKGAIRLMKNEAELAAVLAHEIAHVNHRHIMKQLPPPRERGGISFITSFLVSQGAVVSTAFSEAVAKAENLLFEKGYLIADEYEADESALDYLNATGYSVSALSSFLERTSAYKSKHSGAVVYHTHPPVADRLSRIQDHLKEIPAGGRNAEVSARFMRYRNLVK